MNLIKNKRAWKKWVKDSGLQFQEGVTEPTSYPCYGYTVVQSFGYEELAELYLYPNDIEEMLSKINSVLEDQLVKASLLVAKNFGEYK